ncbi:universal stress protein [Roseovarius nanhaiticus]|uniref:universal stress protein n=1 Tax=Roseovarius nanhaiticus TaxID=573024 RepID=UPI00248FE633|nr:universal stress protein [Roseovarius nanhaiticus]
MKNATVLIAIGKDASGPHLAAKLETLRTRSMRAVILVLGDMPVFPYYGSGMPLYGASDVPIEWQQRVEAQKDALQAKADEVEALLQQHDVPGEVSAVICEPSRIAETIAQRAIFADIAMIGEDLRETELVFREAVYGVLFQSPIGVLLNDREASVLDHAKRVFVAWNSHLSSARAVHLALPLLRGAEEVIIGTVDPVSADFAEGEDPGVDVATWLSHRGCKVSVQQYPSGGQSVADCLLDRARDAGADLIVMGSYGHSRTRQALFGGTTRSLIEQTKQPVFLAH